MKTFLQKIILFISLLAISTYSYSQTTDTYTTSGTWFCPAGVSSIRVEAWGAGGGGGAGGAANKDGGGGGGGGAFTLNPSVSVTAGSSYTITVGVGGTAGLYVTPINGGNGGNSTATFGATTVTANGGSGGLGSANGGTRGLGGTAGTYAGGNGANGVLATRSGGGGGGAGTTGAGGNASGITAGLGTTIDGGDGGSGTNTNGTVGGNGNNYGGGGGGGTKAKNGGKGADGQIKITYCTTSFNITSTTATTPIDAGSSSIITLNGNVANLPIGTYTVTYNLSAPNAATGLTAAMVVSVAGTGTFNITNLLNIGTTTITITQLSKSGCSNIISSNNTSNIVVNTSYCVPAPTSVDGIGITRVVMGTIDNTTGDEAGHYGNYSSLSTNIMQSSTQTCNITFATGYTYVTKIWIDWNNDLDFDDAGEEVYSGTSLATNPTTLAASFVVPITATLGNHRLRIGATDVGPPTPCYTGSYGTYEDYTINVIALPVCSGIPTPGTATSDISSFCNTGTPILSLTGYTIASGITIQWQYSLSNSPYAWNDILGAINSIHTVNPAIHQTMYYRAFVACGSNIAYSNILTITNNAQLITGTNSPQTVVCNTTANLTATSTGGTINWYANSIGGTPLASGSNYNPTITANTTFYCAAGTGGSTVNVGKPTWTSSDGYTGISNWGIRFDALSDFTLVSVKVYPQTAGSTISVILQDNTGTPISGPYTFTAGTAGVIQTLPLNISIPIGTDYRLVSGNSTSLARGSTGVAFPYTAAGICSLTASEWGGTTTGTYYFFYDWVVSTGCESSPRTPVNVVVSGGVTPPTCSTLSSPSNNATGVCPLSTLLNWTASNTACRAATGYKLYFGTDVAATNIHNGIDIGLVTSYTFPTLLASTDYYWKIVPYNTAGDGSCSTINKFTTAINPGSICITNMGTGVTVVPTLPYTSGAGTTQAMVNDLTSSNTVTCGSTSYLGGEDRVWVFTPTTSGSVIITLTSSGTYTGLMVYDNCPLSSTACGMTSGNCIAYEQSSTGNKTLTACVTAGITYYIILDSYPAPTFNAYTNLTISSPSGSIATNDLPCNAIPISLSTPIVGDNSCTSGLNEPITPTCWTTGNLNTIWYSVVCPSSGKLNILTTPNGLTNTQIGIFSGNCNSLTMVTNGCNNDMTGCGSSLASKLIMTGLTPGNTYYISVDGAYNLVGTFSLLAIDGNNNFPTTPGQDCDVPLATCSSVLDVANPGYSNTGSICDFDGVNDCTGGERASSWYTIDISSSGQLSFDIIPNDYSGGAAGDETDYDFLVWKIKGSGSTTCAGISANSANGLVACNYSYLGVTGVSGTGNSPIDPTFDAAYEPAIPVLPGEKYIVSVSNFTLSTSGFSFDFTSTVSGVVNFSPIPVLVSWTGASSVSWVVSNNWGGCSIPSCLISGVVPSTAPRWPKITTNQTIKDLTIDAGARLNIDPGVQLTLCGNLINNGTINFGAGSTIKFNGSIPQTLNSSTPLTIPNLIIDNNAGVSLVNNNITITGALTLTNGILYTNNPSPLLIMEAGSISSTIGSATSYVDGPIQKIGNTAFVFPLGDNGILSQLAITAPTSSTTFQAQYFASSYGNQTTVSSQGAATLNHTSFKEHWMLNRVNGTGNCSVKLYWNNATISGIWLCSNYGDISVARWNGTSWESNNTTIASNALITGNCGTNGTIQSENVITNFSPFTFGTIRDITLNPLPIELISFDGVNRGNVNILTWKTLTETNNNYFVLEKSLNNIDFNILITINGSGNSQEEKIYQTTDDSPYNITYYRLGQVDFDGKKSYSKTISVEKTNNYDKSNVEFIPNPFNSFINIEMKNMNDNNANIIIYDLLGNEFLNETIEINNFIYDTKIINLTKLTNGMYFISFKSKNYNIIKKIIKY